jgi:hypothetical protein
LHTIFPAAAASRGVLACSRLENDVASEKNTDYVALQRAHDPVQPARAPLQ